MVALGAQRRTDGLSVGDEVAVPGFPIAFGEAVAKRHFRFQRRLGLNQAQPVRDAVDVNIDADGVLIEGHRNNQVGGFTPDSGQFAEVLDRIRNPPTEAGVQGIGQRFQVLGLHSPETDREDQLAQLCFGNVAEVLYVIDDLEQAVGRLGCRLVPGSRAQDGRDQHLERILRLGLDELDNGRLFLRVLGFQDAIDSGQIRKFHNRCILVEGFKQPYDSPAMTPQGKMKKSQSRPSTWVASISGAVLRLFDETAHLHGLTKTWRPVAVLLARMAAERVKTGDAMSWSSAWRQAAAAVDTLPVGGKRAVRIAWKLLNERPAPDAVAREAQRRYGDHPYQVGLRLAALVEPILAVASICAVDAITDLSIADDSQRVLLVVAGRRSEIGTHGADPHGLLWNAVMARPLLMGLSPMPHARTQPLFQPDHGVVMAAARLLFRQMEQFRSREYGLRNSRDPEYVHEMRVATRRMRSLLRTFKKALGEEGLAMKKNLKLFARALGCVRDSDVYLAFLREQVGSARTVSERQVLDMLVRNESRRRRRHCAALHAIMEQPACRRFRDGLCAELTDGCRFGNLPHVRADAVALPVHAYAAAALRKGLSQCVKHPRALEQQTPEVLHALRIACKELRYMGECFACLYDDGLKPLVADMRQMQSLLGDVHDADVFAERVRRFRGRQGAVPDAGIPCAGDRLLRALQDRRATCLRKADQVWQTFSRKRQVKNMMRRLAHPKTKRSESYG